VFDAIAFAEQGPLEWRRLWRHHDLLHYPAQWQSAPGSQSGATNLRNQPETLESETSLVGDAGPNQTDSVPPGDVRARIDKGLSSGDEFPGR
jgi:hypothetical protein